MVLAQHAFLPQNRSNWVAKRLFNGKCITINGRNELLPISKGSFKARHFAVVIAAVACVGVVHGKTYRVEDLIAAGDGLAKSGKIDQATMSRAVEHAASVLKAGDALVLSNTMPFDTVTLPPLPNEVQFLGGVGDEMRFTGMAKGLVIADAEYAVNTKSNNASLADSYIINGKGDLNLGDYSNSYIIGNIGAVKAEGNWHDVTGVWIRYNHEHHRTETPSLWFKLNGSGRNVKILCAIEHNQGNERPAVVVENADGMALAHGSTESTSSYDFRPVYQLKDCRNVYLGHRRLFSGGRGPRGSGSHPDDWIEACRGDEYCWQGWPTMGLEIAGGESNIIDNFVGISNPRYFSIKSTDPKLKMFSVCTEDTIVLSPGENPNIFLYSVVQNSMDNIPYHEDDWQEPRLIDDRYICSQKTSDGEVDYTQPGASGAGGCIPAPPSYPKCDIPKPPELLYKKASNFGATLIAAGADPTGARPSDDAFAKVAAQSGIVEVPSGTFHLEKGIGCTDAASQRVIVRGAGPEKTRLTGPGAALAYSAEAFLKGTKPVAVQVQFSDVTFDGENSEDYARSSLDFNDVFINCSFENYLIAGVYHSSTSETEQYRFYSCRFKNTGDYGIRIDGYTDKPLFYRCSFEGQKKGGIYCTRIVHFHGGIYQCTFKNIGGPGVAILGGNMSYGYGPWVVAVDNCTFENCGSQEEAAVEFGVSWLATLANSTFSGTKPILAGFRGVAGIIDNVDMQQLALSDNGVAMYVGNQRWEKTAGVGGTRLANVRTSGKIEFLNYDEFVGNYFVDGNGTSPFYRAGLYDSHDWAFHYMIYNVESANINEEYAVYEDGQRVIDLSGNTYCESPHSLTAGNYRVPRSSLRPTESGIRSIYDLRGRRIGMIRGANHRHNIPAGVHLVRTENGKRIYKRMLVNKNR